MIEIVKESDTTSGIQLVRRPSTILSIIVHHHLYDHPIGDIISLSDGSCPLKKYGGGALGALKVEPLQRFISDHNKDKAQLERAQVGAYDDAAPLLLILVPTHLCPRTTSRVRALGIV
jgi:hypothetical protein